MARIRVPVTQPALQRIEPVPLQRRVIALELHAPDGVGASDFCYTEQLGNRLWLYSINIWVYCVSPGPGIGGFFWIMYGQGVPPDDLFVAEEWNHIIPLRCGLKPGFRWFDCESFHRCFTMAKLFEFDELRFGVAINNGYPQDWEMTVAFEISEG